MTPPHSGLFLKSVIAHMPPRRGSEREKNQNWVVRVFNVHELIDLLKKTSDNFEFDQGRTILY